MKKNYIIVFLLMMIIAGTAGAENYGNIWEFGNHAGINFNSCIPVAITNGANTGFEGCSSICDSTGQLLFYTNSETVWNRNNVAMPNGNLVASGSTLSQVIIIPKPLSVSQYYIVTTQIQASGSLSLRYHVIDMTLNGGMGGVSSSNNVLTTTIVTEQVAATHHRNDTDIWLMAHEYGTNNFLAYQITPSGISTTPVISSVGPAHVACTSNFNARGEIKFSPDGTKIVFNGNGTGTIIASNILTLFDFDDSTGVVSNPLDLPFSRGEFGLSFSDDNSKLYGTTWKAFNFSPSDYNYIYQFDLSSGNPATIIASKVILDSVSSAASLPYGSCKLAPDGKIYVAIHGSHYLGVIHSPDLAGASCNYMANGFYLGPSYTCDYGLNNYIEYRNYCRITDVTADHGNQKPVSIFPDPFSDYATVEITTSADAVMMIYNVLGAEVWRYHVSDHRARLDRKHLGSGLFFYRILEEGNDTVTGRFIVE